MDRGYSVSSAGGLCGDGWHKERDSISAGLDWDCLCGYLPDTGRHGRRDMDGDCAVSASWRSLLGNQQDQWWEGRVWRRVDVSDDWSFYGFKAVFYDSVSRIDVGISDGTDPVSVKEDLNRQRNAVCAVSAVGNGGSCVVIKQSLERERMGEKNAAGKISGWSRGSMTLEASFLISWTVFLFVFFIYLSFYSYDKCVLFQDAYTVCFRGSIQKDENNVVPYISAHIQEQFGRKYFGTGKVQGSVDRKGHVTDVTGECQVKVPIRSLFTMHDAKGWKIRTQARAQIINPTHIIRKSRWVENVLP